MGRAPAVPTAVIGCGRLARSLIPLLGPAGYPVVTVAGRRLTAARSATRGVRGARATTSARIAVVPAQLVLLAVADRAIPELVDRLAALPNIDWKRRTVLHHAGALGLEPLRPLSRVGAAVGVLHPLQSLGLPSLAAELLPGSRARVAGDRRGRAVALSLARALHLVPLGLRNDLTPEERHAYHAAASLFSNDVVALLAVGTELLQSIGLGRRRALDSLLPLLRGTLTQIDHCGLDGPLTGPAVRGDVDTLRAHLRRLSRGSPEDGEIHRLLSIRLARLALERGERAAAATVTGLVGRKRKRRV